MSDITIYEGDAQLLITQELLVDGEVSCIICDPPYGVAHTSFRATTPDGQQYVRDIANDVDLSTAIELFDAVMRPLLERKAGEECEVYVFTRWDIVGEWIEAVRALGDLGLEYKMLLVWDKGVPGMGDLDGNWGCGHELILYCKKGRREIGLHKTRRSGILHHEKLGPRQHIHPTEKPVSLMAELIMMSTEPGELVFDPFTGSGSSMVAAKQTGRRGVAFELDPLYVGRIHDRLGQEYLF